MCFAVVPEYRLLERPCAPVVEEVLYSRDRLCKPYRPERRRSPFRPGRLVVRPVIGKPLAHIVKEEIREGLYELITKLRELVSSGTYDRPVALLAADVVEDALPGRHIGVVCVEP